MKPDIEVKANYSFWRHPFDWFHDYRMRRLLEKIINYRWKNGMEEKVHAMVFHANAYGHTPVIANDKESLHCVICDKDI